jgi:hypothetical protein
MYPEIDSRPRRGVAQPRRVTAGGPDPIGLPMSFTAELAVDVHNELVQNGDVCDNCYLLMWEEFERNFVKEVEYDEEAEEYTTAYDPIDGLPPERQRVYENTETDSAGVWCRCGSDGKSQYRGKLSRAEVSEIVRNAVKTLRTLGIEADVEVAVRRARELKDEDEYGDDDLVLDAVEYALER